jgi:tape measure domain-containing protein
MATAELVVAFGAKLDGLEASLKRVNAKFEDLERSAANSSVKIAKSMESSASTISQFGTNLAAASRQLVALYATIKGLTAIRDVALAVDDLNQSLTRLRVLTNTSASNAGTVFSNLAATARQTGQPVKEVVDQFTRFYNATASLGASQGQVEQFVKVLSQFAQIGGSKPQEAAAAITQLAQGLASGKLQGDELKSILENMPVLAQAIAQALNVSVGTLRQMGEEGKLTADVIFPAILRAGNQMRERLEGIPLSLRQGWQVLTDTATIAVTELDRKIGATSWLSKLLVESANLIRFLGLSAVNTNDSSVPAGTRRDALAQTQTQTAARIAAINEELSRARAEAERLAGLGPQGRSLARDTNANVRRLEEERTQLQGVLRDTSSSLELTRDEIAAEERINADRREREGREGRIRDDGRRAREILEAANPELKARRERDDRIRDLEKTLLDRRIVARQQGAAAEAELTRWEAAQRAAIKKQYDDDVEKAGAGARADAREREAEQRRLRREAEQRARAEQRAVEEIKRAGDTGLVGFTQQMRDWNEANGETASSFELFIGRVAAGTESIEILFRAVSSAAQTAAQSMIAAGESPQPAIDALKTQLDSLGERLAAAGVGGDTIRSNIESTMTRSTNAIQQLGDKAGRTFNDIKVAAVNNFSGGAADAIVDFATTGEQKFDEFAASFLANIAKMILQLLIFRAIATGLGAAGISVPGVTPGPAGRMAGGPVDAGTPYVVGEKRPELFVPGSSGYVFPDVGGGDGVTVNVYNNANANVRTNETTDSQGNRILEIFVEGVVRQGLASGRFDGAMRQNYNLTRPGRV